MPFIAVSHKFTKIRKKTRKNIKTSFYDGPTGYPLQAVSTRTSSYHLKFQTYQLVPFFLPARTIFNSKPTNSYHISSYTYTH